MINIFQTFFILISLFFARSEAKSICKAKLSKIEFEYTCFEVSLESLLKDENFESKLIVLYKNLPESINLEWIHTGRFVYLKPLTKNEREKFILSKAKVSNVLIMDNNSVAPNVVDYPEIGLSRSQTVSDIHRLIKQTSPELNQRLAFTLKMLELGQIDVLKATGLPRRGTELFLMTEFYLTTKNEGLKEKLRPFLNFPLLSQNLICNWPLDGLDILVGKNKQSLSQSEFIAQALACINYKEILDLILNKQLSLDSLPNESGGNLLHHLAESGGARSTISELVRIYQMNPELVIQKNKFGESPLALLIKKCNHFLVESLLKDMIDDGFELPNGNSISEYAYKLGCYPAYKLKPNDELLFSTNFASELTVEKISTFRLFVFDDYIFRVTQMLKKSIPDGNSRELITSNLGRIEEALESLSFDDGINYDFKISSLKSRISFIRSKVRDFNSKEIARDRWSSWREKMEGDLIANAPDFKVTFWDERKKALVLLRTHGSRVAESTHASQLKGGQIAIRNGYTHVYWLDWHTVNQLGDVQSVINNCHSAGDCKNDDVEAVVDIRYHDEYYYLSRSSKIEIYDKNFKLISFIKNPVRKAAHNIRIEGDRIYALDNVVMPTFVFVVDVKDKKNPRVIPELTIDIMGVNHHLVDQWFKDDRWLILASYAHRGGSGITIDEINLNDPKAERKSFGASHSSNFLFLSIIDRVNPKLLLKIDSKFVQNQHFEPLREECSEVHCRTIREKLSFAIGEPVLAKGKISFKNIKIIEMSPFLSKLSRPNEHPIQENFDSSNPIVSTDEKYLYLIGERTGIQVNEKRTGKLLGFYPFERENQYSFRNLPVY